MTFLNDADLSVRLLDHIDHDTTDLADHVWREPADNYTSPDRLRAELALLRRTPVPFCPSAALPAAGGSFARTAGGRALIATRDATGVARVFLNSCRHRGTALAEGCGHATSLSCPYHGWTYRLDGSLRHVPDAYGFPDLDVDAHGLIEVPSIEVAGLIVVDQAGATDLTEVQLPDACAGAPAVMHAYAANRVSVNWKVLLEGFLEGYHIKATHRETFLPYGYDNINVIEHAGPHSRVTFPFRRIERLRATPVELRRLTGAVTRVITLFPNVVIAELSRHSTMVVLEPVDESTTDFVTFQLGPALDVNADPSATAKDLAFVQQGAAEDRDMALAVQRGLHTGANTHVTFGAFEGALSHFHRTLQQRLDGSD
jgi:phenylpropionate dioxygenase-like ring-hydroxylating dioxygenase large terminal subunit